MDALSECINGCIVCIHFQTALRCWDADYYIQTFADAAHCRGPRACADAGDEGICAALRYASISVGLFCAYNRSLLPFGRPLLCV